MSMLSGTTAIVTGATSGIGAAAARRIGAEGADVVVAGRRETEGRAVADAITAAGGSALFVQTDIRREAEVEALVQRTVETFGKLDLAFNNAGQLAAFGPIHEQDAEAYRREMETNLDGVFYAMKHQIGAMLANGGGAIVNNASQLGVVGIGGGVSPYVASKHGVVGLTRAAGLEYAEQGIRVNALALAGVDTALFRSTMGATEEGAAQVAALHPMNRVAAPEEIAPLIVFLLSDQASFVTGAAVAIDGGWTAQ